MNLLLDTNILTRLCYPVKLENRPIAEWFNAALTAHGRELMIYIPEVADYEARRGLLHLALRSGRETTRSLLHLDRLAELFIYLPLNTSMMRRAARLWAEVRRVGLPTAPPDSLDGDVILAAQALEVSGVVVTENVDHLKRMVPAYRWHELPL